MVDFLLSSTQEKLLRKLTKQKGMNSYILYEEGKVCLAAQSNLPKFLA